MIHPTALIDRKAEIHDTAEIGPYVVVEGPVVVGEGCIVGPYVHLLGHTTIGSGNRFHSGAIIGDAPQDLKYKGAPTRLRIGDNNVFREHTTVHRSTSMEGETTIGSGNFLMAGSHVGHNSTLANDVIVANGALIGGHCRIEDRAFISGACLIHQFTRVGRLALMQGGSGISKDLPPFTIATGVNSICGLNVIGLRRAGVSPQERLELKKLYHRLFSSGRNLRESLKEMQAGHWGPAAREMIEFTAAARKGVCRHARRAAIDPGESGVEETPGLG